MFVKIIGNIGFDWGLFKLIRNIRLNLSNKNKDRIKPMPCVKRMKLDTSRIQKCNYILIHLQTDYSFQNREMQVNIK